MTKGRIWIAVALAGLLAAVWPLGALAQGQAGTQGGVSAVQGSAAQDQYGEEVAPAGQKPRKKPGVLKPPVVLSGAEAQAQEEALPLTGAALIAPTLLGAAMLGVGVFLLYRTKRRGS